jgi:hypothetical protein
MAGIVGDAAVRSQTSKSCDLAHETVGLHGRAGPLAERVQVSFISKYAGAGVHKHRMNASGRAVPCAARHTAP